jgi:hypothetical protein
VILLRSLDSAFTRISLLLSRQLQLGSFPVIFSHLGCPPCFHSWIEMGLLDSMNRLKHRIHSSRIPLSPRGQKIMLWVYVGSPVVFGIPFMYWILGREEKSRVSAQKEAQKGMDLV